VGPLIGQLVVATNVFRRTEDGWRVWSHHGSPVLADREDEDEEDGDDGDGPDGGAIGGAGAPGV
jgi:hypothetical protein